MYEIRESKLKHMPERINYSIVDGLEDAIVVMT